MNTNTHPQLTVTARQRRPLGFGILLFGIYLGFGILGFGISAPTPAPAATAPVNLPPSSTLDLTDAARPTLFIAGYAHLDTQWRWAYPLVIRQFLPDTFNQNFDYFKKYPHYTFNWTGAGRYKLIKDYYPDAFEKIRAAVAAGRWFPNGVAWEENDPNVPSAESQIRQFLLGAQFFQKEFNTAPSNEFMLPDCFGFPASLPSILAHCGIRGFSTQKLTWHSANGIPFNLGEWIGPDGNSIIAALNALRYGRKIETDPSRDPDWIARIKAGGDASGIYADFTYMAIGDRGGAPHEVSLPNMEKAVTSTDAPLRVICARADLMFNSITDEQMKRLPKYTGDLLLTEHSAGSINSQACMKHWNRANELLADAAERASVAACLLGAAPYPREKLNGAWQIMLRSQMHDILPGTCLPKAYEYTWNDEVLCMNTFAEVLTHAVGAVAGGLDTRAPAGAVPLVIYNPLSIAREDIVEATIPLPAAPVGASLATPSLQVLDPTGTPVPAQVLSRDGPTCHIAFLAKVPSVAFAVYVASVASVPSVPSVLSVTDHTLENARYRVTLNPAGDIASILDKQSNRELLAAPARLEFLNENPDDYPAWNMDWADRQNPPRARVGDDGKARIEIIENGPVRVALRVTRTAEGSTFEQTIRLSAGSAGVPPADEGRPDPRPISSPADRIEIANAIDWRSKGCSLKAAFPLTVSNTLATYNNDLGKITRGNNDEKKFEVPTHQWFDLTAADNSSGVTILTAAKYGSDKPSDNTVRLTLLYSPGIAKVKAKKNNYMEQRFQDWGRHEFTYGIYAHAAGWREAGSDWQALRMEQPLLAFTTPAHEGKLGRVFSLLNLDTDAVAVRAIKLAEDSDRIIVRLQELDGVPQAGVHLSTPAVWVSDVSEVNGVENPLASLGGTTSVSSVPITIPVLDFQKYQLRSLALTPCVSRAQLASAVSAPLALPHNMNAFGHRGETRDTAGFDATGATLPAEMIPDTITAEGIRFEITPCAAQNAVRCEGQTITLPLGGFNRIYLLAASVNGDTAATFRVGDTATTLTIQNWTGYIGQWDNRVFEGEIPERTYSIANPLLRIDTGFIKRAPVAWYCDHHYDKNGKDAIYSYCYLFKYALDIPSDAKIVTLPANPAIRILAITAAQDPASATRPAHPLYDDFTNRQPITIPAGWSDFQ